MNRRIACTAVLLALAGCAGYSPSVPAGYTGPSADLIDSYKAHSNSKADFFIAEEINGAKIENGLAATLRANRGRGMAMTPISWYRPLVAEQPIKVSIRARTHYAAPILTIVRSVYEVTGVIEFVPKANAKYVVRGELDENYSAVWIEDEKTQEVVGKKFEVKGSAKLGILQK